VISILSNTHVPPCLVSAERVPRPGRNTIAGSIPPTGSLGTARRFDGGGDNFDTNWSQPRLGRVPYQRPAGGRPEAQLAGLRIEVILN